MSVLEEQEAALGALRASLDVLDLRRTSLVTKIDAAVAQVQELCPHKIVNDEAEYFGGSYYDRACTVHRLVCVRCGKLMKTWDETHSWYG